MSESKLPESVTLSDGRVCKKRNVKVRDLINADNQPKGKEYLSKWATIATKLNVDGKPIVLEDLMDFSEEDLELAMTLFVTEDDLKNA